MEKRLIKSGVLISVMCSLFIITLAALAYSIWRDSRDVTNDAIEQAFEGLQQDFQNELNGVINNAMSITVQETQGNLIHSAQSSPLAFDNLNAHWNALFKVYPTLQQIRFISNDGSEIIRADRHEARAVWRAPDELQNKSNRYYFIEGLSGDHDIYISSIDLNKENGVVELPLRPTIRSTGKYWIAGELKGLVVLNFDLRSLFSRLNVLQKETEHWLVNPDGYFLTSPDETNWGWLLDHTEDQIRTRFPGLIENFYQGSSKGETYDSSLTWGKIDISHQNSFKTKFAEPHYWVIMKKPESLQAYLKRNNYLVVGGFLLGAALLIFLAGLLHKLFNNLALERDKATSAEQAKAEFLARMSHEIRTPMNGVYGLLQITQGERDYQKINDNIEQAITSFSLLSRIIDDVLDFSKIEAGKLDIVEAPFRLDSLLNQTGQMMGRAAYGKHIELWIDIDPNCPKYVIGDSVRLNQIITNLISNAIKFTTRGEVNLRVERLHEDSKTVQLGFEISDTGIGMTPDQVSKIFSAFTQASKDTNSKFGGTGLGLSIARQLVEMMGGKIGVTSKKDIGSTFQFNVNLKKVEAQQCSLLDHQTILSYQATILTQNVNAETIIQRQCSVLGWPSYVARSLEELNHQRPDSDTPRVLLIDESILDKIDEGSLSEWQRKQKNITHLVIVSHNRKEFGENMLMLCDNMLLKPFTPSTLYDKVIGVQKKRFIEDSDDFPEPEKALARTLILVVEDNPINQQVAGAMLKSAGAVTKFAENGKECLELLQKGFKPHLILMDMQMPVMGGVEAAQNIRKDKRWDNIPIIAMTANAMESDKKACIDAGMQAHIAKPVVKDELISIVLKRLA